MKDAKSKKTPTSHPSNSLLQAPQKHSKWLLAPFAVLFALFGVFIIIKSFASTAPTDPNDVLRGGFNTSSQKAAQDDVILKLNSTAPENNGAKQLFAYFGITDTEIRAAQLIPQGIRPNDPNSPYANWNSFGRTQRAGSTRVPPAPQTFNGAVFWAKPVKIAWASGTNATQAVLKGKTKDGRDFLIHGECGNLVMPGLAPFHANPAATIVKQAVSPGNKAVVKPGDLVKYRLIAKSTGNTSAYVIVADKIPIGTTFVSADIETKNALPLDTITESGQKVYRWANYGLSAGDSIKILVTVKVNSGTRDDFCNIAYVTWFKGQTIPAKSAEICHKLNPGSPLLSIDKVLVGVGENTVVRVGDILTYKVTGRNKGTVASVNAAIWDGVKSDGWFEFVDIAPLMKGVQTVPDSDIAEKVVAKVSGDYKYYGYTKKSLAPNEVVSFTIRFKVIQAQNPANTVCNLAIISDNRTSPFGVWGADKVCSKIEGVELHKSATFINRKGSDGKPLPADGKNVAMAGDVIEYSLSTKNIGATKLTAYEIREDINDVLEYADIIDNGAATLSAGVLTWKADIDPGTTLIKKFRVKVKSPIPTVSGKNSSPGSYDYKMVNIYGDTVTIPVNKPIVQTIIDTLPATGALGALMIPLALATLVLLAYTSGIFGRNKPHHAGAEGAVKIATEVPRAHGAETQFHPESKSKEAHKPDEE